MLITAILPLIISMGLALWHSSNQTTQLTIELTQGRLDTAAQKLSGFFSARISEISAYSQFSLFKSMDFKKIRPFLISELSRHENTYEKFILGTPEGYFYNTSGGNPDVLGLRTTNDRDPKAKPKHIKRRDYWQKTVGNNTSAIQNTVVSDPMISYTTGAKQVVIASTILSTEGNVNGMIGGALPWDDIHQRVKQINDEITEQFGRDVKFFLVSDTGTYWYHWDKTKVVHLKRDNDGKPFINDIGEKEIIKSSIFDEKIPEFVSAGKRMINGERGFSVYTNPITNSSDYIVFSHIPSANYSIGLVIQKEYILDEVNNLQSLFVYIFILATFAALFIAYTVSTNISSPIVLLNNMTKKLSQGDWGIRLPTTGKGEIRELTESFNSMSESLEQRETMLKQSEQRLATINNELEQRITERTSQLKESNEQLVQEISERSNVQRLLKTAGELAHIGGWKLNVLTNTLEWTDETFRIHDLPNGQTIDFEKSIAYYPDESKAIFVHCVNLAKTKGTPFDLELPIVTEQNRQIWVRVICEVNKENDNIIELVGAYQDISELKKIEKIQNEFVSAVSHELRTPLTAIHGSLVLLNSNKLDDSNPALRNEMLNIAERNSDRLLLLINDILDMEKIESGKLDFTMSNYNLGELISQAMAENDAIARKYNVTIKLVTDIPDTEVHIDKERLFQILTNLISNAAKFSPENSVIEVSTLLNKDEVCISIQDYGSGIPDDFRDKIFTKFSQADNSNIRQQGGTGLGLSICKSIINSMGGNIGYESKPGEGSRFYITFPLID